MTAPSDAAVALSLLPGPVQEALVKLTREVIGMSEAEKTAAASLMVANSAEIVARGPASEQYPSLGLLAQLTHLLAEANRQAQSTTAGRSHG